MNLIALPAFTDNYFEPPGESTPVVKALDALAPMLTEILVTRRQHDPGTGAEMAARRLRKNNIR
jgi:hypothetical protein